ncbi:MAG: FtsX-like permease family protein [Spirochaetales bacterium]|nr:FtsX-like permease family protein [Spirochaetales bacterium]
MGTIEKIAVRNLKEHKAKTLIIGILIAVGIMVMILSNSILDSAEKGSKEVFIENYTAHLLVSKKMEKGKMSAFGYEAGMANMMMGGSENPTIPEYAKVYDYLSSIPEAKAVNSQTAGLNSLIKFDETMDNVAFTNLWGIDPESYTNMFPDNIVMMEGEFLKTGESGVILNYRLIEDIQEEIGKELKVGDIVTFQSLSGGMKLYEVPLRGIFKYRNGNGSVFNMSIIDVESYRVLARMIVGTTDDIKVADEEQELLEGDFDFDTMFSDEIDVASTDDNFDFDSVLGDLSVREAQTKPSTGTWSFTLIMLNKISDMEKVKTDIETWALENDIPLEVQTWEDSAGSTGETVKQLKFIINIFIIIVAIVTVIIIMNTLVVSIMERTSEIGTMRAVGAQKGFVRRLFIAETFTISMVFGTIGIVIALIVLFIFNKIGISFGGNALLEALFAGEVLYPVTSIKTIISGYLISVLIGLVSSFYPVSIALKIDPIKAIQS